MGAESFVLIHSTGQSPAGWERVIAALERRGRAGLPVDLPSSDDLRAADYAELIQRQAGDVADPVVVAHSGAGALLPAAARTLGAVRQVWVAAWVPDPRAAFLEEALDLVRPDWVGKDPIADADVAVRFLYHDCDDATREWALSTRREFLPRAVYHERIERADDIPSTYVLCTRDRTITPDAQRRMARERLRVEPFDLDAGHCPNVSQPDRLAELLTQPPP